MVRAVAQPLDRAAKAAVSLDRAAKVALSLDRAVLVAARTRLHGARAERLIGTYSRLGEHGACWLLLGAVGALADRRQRAAWLRGVRIVGAAYALNYAVKVTVHRRRPELQGLPPLTKTVSRLTFPSAHATTSFAAARAYAGLVPRASVYIPAFAFGLSRPYLGVHYPSDVAAGALLGTAIAAAWPAPPAEPRPTRAEADPRENGSPASEPRP
jgi:membrane-associated phospholipid phosphatase